MAVKPTGDVDDDFVAMMASHHQGAIDMSESDLRYGHNEQLMVEDASHRSGFSPLRS